MNPPDSPPGAPPPAPPARGGPPRLVLVGLGLAVLAAVGAGAFLLGRRSAGPDSASGGASVQPGGETSGAGASTSVVQALPPVEDEPRQLEVPYQAAPPAFWVDVHAPARAYQALAGNAWLKEQLDKPLGQGFVGGWSAFLGSSGEDLGGSFKGAVLDVVAGKLLASPFRMVWFSGQERSGTPALIVPEPGSAAEASFASMSGVARRETAVAESCPGGEGEVPAGGFQLERWLVAEQALWAGRVEDRMVFARSPLAVLQGLCAPTVERDAPEGVDVELGFDAEALGRETQLLAHVLGLAPGTRLQFAIEGQRLVGRGIAGELTDLVGLDSAPLSEELLKLVPEETPVLLALQLKLPEVLERGTLKAFLSGRYKGATRTRQVALLWTPRGDASLPTELALVWGQPEDLPALRELFPYGFAGRETLCGHAVLGSTGEVMGRLDAACRGQLPNMLNAAGPVVQGLRAPGSVVFGVHTGRLLGLLIADGYWSRQRVDRSKPLPPAAPPEIEAARKDLETLPYLGLRGTVEGSKLVPGGFGS